MFMILKKLYIVSYSNMHSEDFTRIKTDTTKFKRLGTKYLCVTVSHANNSCEVQLMQLNDILGEQFCT